MKNNTFKIYTLGCKVNQSDSRELANLLSRAGFSLVSKNTDMAIINSCAVTKTAMSKSKRIINKAKKENPNAKIILIGCWPKVYNVKAKKLGVDLIWEKNDIENLLREIKSLFGFAEIPRPSTGSGLGMTINADRSRYFLKIQDGCEQYCSYCIIPYARGKLWSRPMDEVVEEAEQAVQAGFKEIVLCGIHLGRYLTPSPSPSQERGEGGEVNLVSLLKNLIKIKDLGRIRLSSIEINEVSNNLIKLMASTNKICHHLHLPLQSGSDKILKLMNRPYAVKYYKNKIRKIRKLMPNIAITTDVMVGFPGETEKEFKQTHDFIKTMKFSRLHVFPFSAHERTAASKMSGQVSEQEKKTRAKLLRQLGKKLAEQYKEKFKGRELMVVVERKLTGDKYLGKAEYYFDTLFYQKQILSNELSIKNLIGKIIKVKK